MADYLSGELPPSSRASFAEHLTVCPNCVTYLANYEKAISLGQSAFNTHEGELPGDVPADLVKAILASRSSRP